MYTDVGTMQYTGSERQTWCNYALIGLLGNREDCHCVDIPLFPVVVCFHNSCIIFYVLTLEFLVNYM